MTPVQRLTGDFITSSEIGHLKKVGTVMHRSIAFSLTMVDESGERVEIERNKRKVGDERTREEGCVRYVGMEGDIEELIGRVKGG